MKTIIVTGASRGIGAAIVRSLRVDGIRVVGIARSEDNLRKLSLEKIGQGPFEYVAGDIREAKILEKAVALALEGEHSLIGLVLNAAVLEPMVRIKDMDLSSGRDHFEVNLFSQIQLIKQCLPGLRKTGGRIVFVSSGIVNHPSAGWSLYAASKGAMNYIVQCLAEEEPDITCVSVRPGVVDTDMFRMASSKGSVMTPERVAWLSSVKDNQQLVQPEVPGSAIAKIAQRVPKELSGSFLVYDDPKLMGI